MKSALRRGLPALLLAAVVVGACIGEGSDIGPSLPKLPPESFIALVRGDGGDGVCNAFVSVAQISTQAEPTRRSGWVDAYVSVSGYGRVDVGGEFAAAVQGDDLVGLSFATDLGGGQLPFVAYLPDLAPSQGVTVEAGIQAAAVTLDDSATSGAVLTIPAGVRVDFGGEGSALLRSGGLAQDHLPPVQMSGVAGVLATRGAFVDPLEMTVTPGATLALPNDLGLGAGATARLMWLDPSSGEWLELGDGAVDGTGASIVSDGGLVARGGLYCFAIPSQDLIEVSGRLLSSRDQAALADMLVRIGQSYAVSSGDGSFVLYSVPAADGSGTALSTRITYTGGRSLRESSQEVPVDLTPSQPVDLGDVEVENTTASDLRVMTIIRGRSNSFTPLGIGSTEGDTGGQGISDIDGMAVVPKVETGYLSFLETIPSPIPDDQLKVQSVSGFTSFFSPERTFDFNLFLSDNNWMGGDNRQIAMWVVDRATRAAIANAYVYRWRDGLLNLMGQTPPERIQAFDFGGDSVAISTAETESEGRSVISAFATTYPRNGRLEQPMPRANRKPLGNFAPYAQAVGRVSGSGAKFVVVTSRVVPSTWMDSVFEGRSLMADVPVELLPQVAGGDDFAVGVPLGGAVAGSFGTIVDGVPTLEGFGFAGDLNLDRAAENQLDLGEPVLADTTYTVPGALQNLDARIAPEEFALDLGVASDQRLVLDVIRGLKGNLSVAGEDLQMRLPALSGRLAGWSLFTSIGAEVDEAGASISQRAFYDLRETTGPATSLLPVPEITSPAPGSQVSAAGFTVEFTLPTDAVYGYMRLSSEDGTLLRDWQVLLRQEWTSFEFIVFPEGPNVLAPGNFKLELIAAKMTPDSPIFVVGYTPFDACASRFMGISRFERGVIAESSIAIDIELVP